MAVTPDYRPAQLAVERAIRARLKRIQAHRLFTVPRNACRAPAEKPFAETPSLVFRQEVKRKDLRVELAWQFGRPEIGEPDDPFGRVLGDEHTVIFFAPSFAVDLQAFFDGHISQKGVRCDTREGSLPRIDVDRSNSRQILTVDRANVDPDF